MNLEITLLEKSFLYIALLNRIKIIDNLIKDLENSSNKKLLNLYFEEKSQIEKLLKKLES